MVVTSKGFLLGAAAGALLTGAAAAGATAGFNAANDGPRPALGVEQPELIRAQNLTSSLVRPPAGAPLSFADIIERVSPAVVSLEVTGQAPRAAAGGRGLPPGFEEFFGLTPRGGQGGANRGGAEPGEEGEEETQRTQASGSGFFISADGYIVTNNHVVENAREITVHLSDDRELKARVVGRDEGTDLAVLKVEGRNFPFVQFATGAQPRVGDWVVAIGNPFQLNGTATAGIVSAKGRDIGEQYVDYLQIDAPINRGNSGGPTFDLNGRVIGVNTAIYSTSGSSAGVGFAIPADTAEQVTRQLISGGRITRGYIGVALAPNFDADAAESLGLRSDNGALIADVTPGGPSSRAGLRSGDVVLRVNGQPIENSSELTRRVASVRPGETVRLDIWRGGRNQTVNIVATTRPSEQELRASNEGGGATPGGAPSGPAQVQGPPVLGMSLAPLDEATRRRLNLDGAVTGAYVERVDPNSDAADKGVTRGVVITRANDRPITSPADVQAVIADARRQNRSAVLLWFRTAQGNTVPLAIRLQPRSANG